MEKEEENSSETRDIDSLYLQVPDIGYWADCNDEIRARWEVERDFVDQVREDRILQQIFERVKRKEPPYTDEMKMWDRSQIKSIGRMFMNRFDMDFALVEVAKTVAHCGDNENYDVIVEELGYLHAMAIMFDDEGSPFALFKDRIKAELKAFVQWRSGLDNMSDSETITYA